MRRNVSLYARILFSLFVVSLAACSSRGSAGDPVPARPDATPRSSTTNASAPRPGSADDQAPDIWNGDLDAINEHVRRNGLLGDVHFDYDDAGLSQAARDRLAANARFLAERSELVVTVEGHCDERGTAEYNLALGDRRSHSAIGYLRSLGVGDDRLRPMSYGKERPACSEVGESCWSRNRRAAFVVIGRNRTT